MSAGMVINLMAFALVVAFILKAKRAYEKSKVVDLIELKNSAPLKALKAKQRREKLRRLEEWEEEEKKKSLLLAS